MTQQLAVPAKGDYIHGSFIRPPNVNGSVRVLDPGDLDHVIGTFPFAPANVDIAVVEARTALNDWRELPVQERVERLRAVPDELMQITNGLAQVVTCEVGKPIWESRMEILAAVRQCDILLRDGPELLQSTAIDTIRGSSQRWPLGVVAALAPSPVPVFVPVSFVVSALLAGNAVVFKPSSRTPATGQLLAEALDRCGLPRGVFNMLQGPGEEIGAALAAHDCVDAVVLAGHLQTSRSVVRAAEGQVRKRIIAQTGGKGTAVVLEDADLDRAVYETITGAFLTAGQRFNSTARAVVEDGIYDAFLQRCLRVTRELRIGYGLDEDVFMGPVLSAEVVEDVLQRVGKMEQQGASVPLRGQALDSGRPGHYLSPTILEHAERSSNSSVPEEVPGPLLALERSAGRETTWAAADRATYGLCAAVFTADAAVFHEAQRRLHVGTLNCNRATVAASGRLPMAAWGRAGKGSEGNAYLIRALSHPTSVLGDPGPFDPGATMPGVTWTLPEGS